MSGTREAVILLHGLWMNQYAMAYLGRALRRSGFTPAPLGYRSMRGTLDEHLAAIARRVASLPADVVHLVGHSLGGVVALRYLQGVPDARIGRTVMLGSPLAGALTPRALAQRPAGRFLLGVSREIFCSDFDVRIEPRFCVGSIAGSRKFGLGSLVSRLPGANDGVVTVEETRLPALADHLVLPVSHSGMLVSARVVRQVAAFLRQGRFDR
jgi:pimeloyl-ACP methyl ester carboxylesterase